MSSQISPLSYMQATPKIAQAASSQSATAGTTPAKKSIGGVAPSENTFLTLLVAQLKNQDPLTPTDSTQFVSELAQFSSLEKLTTIDTNVATMTGAATASSGSGSSAASNAASAAALAAASANATTSGSSSLSNSALTNAINSSGMLSNVSS